MKHKTRESLREIRLWGVQILAPAAIILTNPEVQRFIKHTANVALDGTKKTVNVIKKKIESRKRAK